MRKAVIDVGSNSVLLLVAERTDSGWRTVTETSNVSSLGEGTKQTGVLSEAAMARTLVAISQAFQVARDAGAESIVAAATMAARIAKNADEFVRRAAEQGTPVKILSGEDEAELGFRAVADDPTFADQPRISIIDVGGQSTELVTADRTDHGWDIAFRKSFSVGTLGLKGTCLADESPGPMALLQAVGEIDQTIGMTYRPGEGGYAVALGATGTNLVSIRDRMTHWDPARVHGAWLDFEEVSKAVGWMMPMSNAERAAIVGMEPGREKTLPAGALILERFLQTIGVTGCAVSVRGWRHAMLERA